MEKHFSGFCPKYNTEYSIDITYKKITMVGDPRTYYKKCNYYCEKANSQGCNLNPCPIHLKAPNSL